MPRRAIVLTFDRCHLGYLACYGNEWVETPNLNQLALSSVVFDQCYGEHFSPAGTPPSAHHAWWTGRYEFPRDPRQPRPALPSLADLLRHAGVHSQLLVEAGGDESSLVSPAFDAVHTIRGQDDIDASESEIPFARLVLAAEHALQSAPADTPQLIWLKSRGIPLPWLPPREFADLYFSEFGLEDMSDESISDEPASPAQRLDDEVEDEDDAEFDDEEDDIEEYFEPVIESGIEAESETDSVEEFEFEERGAPAAESNLPPPDGYDDLPDPDASPQFDGDDADSVDIRYARALYAGYLSCLDRWLGKLLSLLADRDSETLFIVTAAAGSNIGERGTLDETVPTLREELVHVPLLIRVPERDQDGSRRRAFVQTVDIAPTLLDWFGVAAEPLAGQGRSLLPLVAQLGASIRECAVMGDTAGARALRTPDFFLAVDASDAPPRLFAKPYDRWDMQDLARDYPDDVERLAGQLTQLEGSLQAAPG